VITKEQIKQKCNEAGGQRALARLIGADERMVRYWVSGQRPIPASWAKLIESSGEVNTDCIEEMASEVFRSNEHREGCKLITEAFSEMRQLILIAKSKPDVVSDALDRALARLHYI
jgi:DNA-binding transcriptional regulator YdaS (Cro superfamily)